MRGRRIFKSVADIPAHLLPADLSTTHVTSHRREAPCSKYGNVRTVYDGKRFDSKREARCYEALLLRRAAGEFRAIIRQVSLPLPSGKRRMRVDFLAICNDGSVRWIDAKGYATREWLIKRDEVEAAYGIRIETM